MRAAVAQLKKREKALLSLNPIKQAGYPELPAWAPRKLLENYVASLEYAMETHADSSVRFDSILMLARLCSYHPGMKAAWEALSVRKPSRSSKNTRPYKTKYWEKGNPADLLVESIIEDFWEFYSIPKITKSERNALLIKAAQQCEELSFTLNLQYFWGNESALALRDILQRAIASFIRERQEEFDSEISQPNRKDFGFKPFLINRVLAAVMSIHGRPHESSVALIVSAILNLKDPLDRNDIHPYAVKMSRKK